MIDEDKLVKYLLHGLAYGSDETRCGYQNVYESIKRGEFDIKFDKIIQEESKNG